MKLIWLALCLGLLWSAACTDATSTPTPTVSRATAIETPSAQVPTVQPHPVSIDRIGDTLLQAAELPGGLQLWTQEDGDRGNIWGIGLCGTAAGPSTSARFDRRFAQHRADLNGVQSGGFVIESILVFAPGNAAQFMSDLRTSSETCRSELEASGRALFGAQFPRIRNESQVYSVESLGCCATPLPTDDQQPHDMVYIRDGDVVLHIYGTADEAIEFAARLAEDHVDGVPARPN